MDASVAMPFKDAIWIGGFIAGPIIGAVGAHYVAQIKLREKIGETKDAMTKEFDAKLSGVREDCKGRDDANKDALEKSESIIHERINRQAERVRADNKEITDKLTNIQITTIRNEDLTTMEHRLEVNFTQTIKAEIANNNSSLIDRMEDKLNQMMSAMNRSSTS